MSPSRKLALVSVLVMLAMGGVFGTYYLDTSSTILSQQQMISGLQSTASSLLSRQASLTAASTTTSMVSVITTRFIAATSVSTTTTTLTTQTITTTTTLIQTVSRFPNTPWDRAIFMEPPVGPYGACSGSSCFGGNFSYAILFDCPYAATQGCAVQIYNSWVKANFSIVAWYPRVPQANEPNWANCLYKSYVLSPQPGIPPQLEGTGFGYCVPIGSQAFIISEEAPPT